MLIFYHGYINHLINDIYRRHQRNNIDIMTNTISTLISPEEKQSKEDYEILMKDYYRVNPDTYNPVDESIPDNVPTKQFKSTTAMYELLARLEDTGDLLESLLKIIKDDSVSRTKHRQAARSIEKYVLPMITITQSILKNGADHLSPKGGGVKAQEREDVETRRELTESGEYKAVSPDIPKLLIKYLDRKAALKMKRIVVSERVTRKRKRDEEAAEEEFALPTPRNGKDYGVGEFLDLVTSKTTANSTDRHKLIKAIMDRKFVMKGTTCLYKHIKRASEGEIFSIDQKWNKRGNKPIWDKDDIEAYGTWIKSRQGVKHTVNDLNNALVQSMIKNGAAISADTKLCDATLIVYDNIVSKQTGISLCYKSNPKTNARWTAERSNIGTMAFIVVAAAAHFYTTDFDSPDINNELDAMDRDSRQMYDMVKKFYKGKPVRVRDPSLILNLDDTTDYFCLGKQQDKKSTEKGIVASSRLPDNYTHSTHHHEDSHKMSGLRCKRTLLMNARGDCAAPCYTLPGLTDTEMPGDQDFIALKIEGLCIGGHGVDRQAGYGYLLLMKGTKGAEKRRFRWIQDVLLKEFIDWIRSQYFGFIRTPSTPIPEEMRAVFWSDGDTSQLASTTSSQGIEWFREMGVIACKHNAAGTGKEQAADLGNCFSLGKLLNKHTTVEHILPKNHPLKRRVAMELQRLSDAKLFRHVKHAHIVDYISKQPILLAACNLSENIVKGWTENGIIDAKHRQYPVIKKMIATCKKIDKLEDFQRYFSAFDGLLDYTVNNGNQHISDEVFMSYGFPSDTDAYGETVIRNATISQENQQRAKILTGEAEVLKRSQRDMEIELVARQKDELAKSRADNVVNGDMALINKLCTYAGLEATEDNVKHCTIEHFWNLKKDELHAFILARDVTITDKNKADVKRLPHPNGKKSIADAKQGIRNALRVAFDLRAEPSQVLLAHLGDNSVHDDELLPTTTEADDSPLLIEVVLRPELHGIVQPSDKLADEATFNLIMLTFDRNKKMACSITYPPTSNLLQKADCLYTHLKMRLRVHTTTRVNADRQNNKCLSWARRNLAVVAAYMIIADHVVTDLTCVDEFGCLLRPPTGNSFLICANEELSLLGCYLHYDTNKSIWVRSGSAAGVGGFGQRLEQHKKRAESDTNPDNSQFYDNYPSSASLRSKSRCKRGIYEHLDKYIGAAFSREYLPPGVFSRDGLLSYTDEEVAWINQLHCHGKTVNEKYMQMAAYLFELGYDLAMSRIHNVSNSPGFEGCGLMPTNNK